MSRMKEFRQFVSAFAEILFGRGVREQAFIRKKIERNLAGARERVRSGGLRLGNGLRQQESALTLYELAHVGLLQ